METVVNLRGKTSRDMLKIRYYKDLDEFCIVSADECDFGAFFLSTNQMENVIDTVQKYIDRGNNFE